MLTFSVRHMHPSGESSRGEPVLLPTSVVTLTEAVGRLAWQDDSLKGPPSAALSTSVQVLSDPSEQKRFEFCQRNIFPPLLTSVFPEMTDPLRYVPGTPPKVVSLPLSL